MLSTTLVSLLALSALATGQLIYNNVSGTFGCTLVNGAYCAGESLTSNIIIRCVGIVGQPGNCNDNLAGVPPVGVKSAALCYQTSETSGDAQCSFLGNIFPNGTAVPISGGGGTGSLNSTSTSSSTTSNSTTSSTTLGSQNTTNTAASPTTTSSGTTGLSTLTTIQSQSTAVPIQTTVTTQTTVTGANGSTSVGLVTLTTIESQSTAVPIQTTVTTQTTVTGANGSTSVGLVTLTTTTSPPPSGTAPVSVFKGAAGLNRACGGLIGVAVGLVVVALF